MILPAFRGVDAVAAVPELCNPRGFVLIDLFFNDTASTEIYTASYTFSLHHALPI
jgi:sulfide:quinone oxidoreductase